MHTLWSVHRLMLLCLLLHKITPTQLTYSRHIAPGLNHRNMHRSKTYLVCVSVRERESALIATFVGNGFSLKPSYENISSSLGHFGIGILQ